MMSNNKANEIPKVKSNATPPFHSTSNPFTDQHSELHDTSKLDSNPNLITKSTLSSSIATPFIASHHLQPVRPPNRINEISRRISTSSVLTSKFLQGPTEPVQKNPSFLHFSNLAKTARPRYRLLNSKRASLIKSNTTTNASSTSSENQETASSSSSSSDLSLSSNTIPAPGGTSRRLTIKDIPLPDLSEASVSQENLTLSYPKPTKEFGRERALKNWKFIRTFISKKFFSNLTVDTQPNDGSPFFTEMTKLWSILSSHLNSDFHFTPSDSPEKEFTLYSLDKVSDLHLASLSVLIQNGLLQTVSKPSTMSNLNCQLIAWKLCILMLYMNEPVDRLLGLHVICDCLSVLSKTCLDVFTRTTLIQVLMEVANHDELEYNRSMAIHVLGELSYTLILEHSNELAEDIFQFLVNELHQLQFQFRNLPEEAMHSNELIARKQKLFLALSKFLKSSLENTVIRNTILYLVYHEMKFAIQSRLNKPEYFFLIEAAMTILFLVQSSDLNKMYMGALFQEFIKPMMSHTSMDIQRLGIYFASLWLPITHQTAHCLKYQILLEGLKHLPSTHFTHLDKEELERLLRHEETQLDRRNRTCWHLLQMPGTSCFLSPLIGLPGWFGCCEPLMPFTSAILLYLPIPPETSILLSRPLPRLEGVPISATTVPPVFMDPNFAVSLPAPSSPYEVKERIGGIPCLPSGYTYHPHPYSSSSLTGGENGNRLNGSSPSTLDPFMQSNVPYGFSLEPFQPLPESLASMNSNPSKFLSFKQSNMVEVDEAYLYNGYATFGSPLLFPPSLGLVSSLPDTEFLLHAPLVLDLQLPEKSIRLQTRIIHLDKHFDPLLVEDRGLLSAGARFNLHIRHRNGKWHTIHVQVEDTDPQPIEIHTNARSFSPAINVDGMNVYAPPANVSPLPTLYSEEGEALYSTPPVLQPAKTLTGELTHPSLPLAGFDVLGRPFYLPKGCKLPSPSGYTRDGIPFYDIATMLLERGNYLGCTYVPPLDMDFIHYVKSVAHPFRSLAPSPFLSLDDIRHYEDVSHFKPMALKTIFDPPILQFQSVSETVTKPCLLKYRALRGDHQERECFLCIEPADVFAVDVFHVKLQGEGLIQLKISYAPHKTAFDTCQGSLSLIDESGKAFVTCQLAGLKKSFVKLLPLELRFGWVLPNQTLNMELMCSNISNTIIHLQFKVSDKVFHISETSLKLQAKESKILLVTFEPSVVGAYASSIEVNAPAGETISIPLIGACGVPIVLYPESHEVLVCTPTLLVRERSFFISKIFRLLETESALTLSRSLPETEQSLFASLLYAIDPLGRHQEAVCIDFSVVPIATPESGFTSRYLTIFNISKEAMLCCISSSSSELLFEPLVRIAPGKANLVVIQFRSETPGPFRGHLFITCPGFTSIVCHVKAHVGCPFMFTSLQTAWMEPQVPSAVSSIQLPLVNLTDLVLEGTVELIFEKGDFWASTPNVKLEPYSLITIEVQCRFSIEIAWCIVQVVMGTIHSNSVRCIAFPLWDTLSLQDLESLIHWLDQIHYPFPPSNPSPLLLCNQLRREWDPNSIRPIIQTTSPRIQANEKLTFKNFTPSSKLHFLISPGWTFPKMTSHVLTYNNDGKNQTVDIELKSVTVPLESYGFLIVYPEACTPIFTALIHAPTLMIFPPPSMVDDTFEIKVDFGTLESRTNSSFPSCLRSVLLVNTSLRQLHWTARISSGKGRHVPFELQTPNGILEPFKTFLLTFSCHPSLQGIFETTCELKANDNTFTTLAKSKKQAHFLIQLKVRVILTNLKGLPMSHDFGNCVTGSMESFSFKLENVCNVPVKINFLPRPPFQVSPNNLFLFHDSEHSFQIIFSPSESSGKYISQLIPCFMNHIVKSIRVSGMGGSAELKSNLPNNLLDFGSIPSSSVAWMTFSLTNTGTLPLNLEHILSPRNDLLVLELVRKQYMVTNSIFELQKDYWGMVKSKLKLLAIMGQLVKRKVAIIPSAKNPTYNSKRPLSALSTSALSKTTATRIPITLKASYILSEMGLGSELFCLQPMQTFSFRLGFTPTNQTTQSTVLDFVYTPIVSQQQPPNSQTLSIQVTGHSYRLLDFHPLSINFGLHPVILFKNFFSRATHAISKEERDLETSTRYIRISNLGLEVQNVSLILSTSYLHLPFSSNKIGNPLHTNKKLIQKTSATKDTSNRIAEPSHLSAFHIQGRQWTLGPGQSVKIPVKFLPYTPQMQYTGEAHFQHNHGVSSIQFSGTGGTAEIQATDELHFGSVPLLVEKPLPFILINKGLLSSTVYLQIGKNGPFRFDNTDAHEVEVFVDPGCLEEVLIYCLCRSKEPSFVTEMTVKWLKTPNDPKPIIQVVRLIVEVGFPLFSLDLNELDFGVVYTSKTLSIRALNEGNASCEWSIKSDPLLQFSSLSGTLEPNTSFEIQVTFQPINFEPLETRVEFVVGTESHFLLVTGIVGMPYLQIPNEYLMLDFGIVQINQDHQLEIPLVNSGPKELQFTFQIEQLLPIFQANPSKGSIPPKTQVLIEITARPQQFSAVYNCIWIVSSDTGEKYDGSCSCIGGQAIVKLSSLFHEEETGLASDSLSISNSNNRLISSSDSTTYSRFIRIESEFVQEAALALKEHMKVLKQVYSDLSSPKAKELEQELQRIDFTKRARTPKNPRVTSPNRSFTPDSLKSVSNPNSRLSTPASLQESYHGKSFFTSELGSATALPPIAKPDSDRFKSSVNDSSISSIRPHSQGSPSNDTKLSSLSRSGSSFAKERWMEGSLFELKDVQRPVYKLFCHSKKVIKRLETRVDEIMSKNPSAFPSSFLSNYLDDSKNQSQAFGRSLLSEEVSPPASSAIDVHFLEKGGKKLSDAKTSFSSSIKSSHKFSEVEQDEQDDSYTEETEFEGIAGLNESFSQSYMMTDSISRMDRSTNLRASSGHKFSRKKMLFESKRMNSPKFLESELRNSGFSDQEKNDPLTSSKALPKYIESHLQYCKAVIQTLQEHIPHMDDSINIQILQKNADALLQSTALIEKALYKSEEGSEVRPSNHSAKPKIFDLGLHLSGTEVTSFLFNLPNVGNLPFSFDISIQPTEMEHFFRISQTSGTISPGESIPLSATFMAKDPGTYRAACELSTQGAPSLSFSLQASAGLARLSVASSKLDFGMQCIHTTENQMIELSNSGTFKERVTISLNALPFELDMNYTEVEIFPNEKISLPITFTPVKVGAFSAIWTLVPSNLSTLSIELHGEGACPMLKVNPDEHLHFPDLFVGQTLQLPISITNVGTWEAKLGLTLNPTLPSFGLKLEEELPGLQPILLPKEKTSTCFIEFSPVEQLFMETQLQIEEFISKTQKSILISGLAGEFSVGSEGDFTFENLKVNTAAESSIKLTNYGNFPVQLQFELTPEEFQPWFTLLYNGESLANHQVEMVAGATSTVLLRTYPESPKMVTAELKLLASCSVGKETRSETFSFPISYMCFEQSLMLNQTQEEYDFGVWAAGKTSDFVFNVTNFDTHTAIIRAHIETQKEEVSASTKPEPTSEDTKSTMGKSTKAKGKSKKQKTKGSTEVLDIVEESPSIVETLCWSVPVDTLELASGETGQFVARFLATNQVNVTQLSSLKLEFSLDNGVSFKPLHSYVLKGKSGLPKVELKTLELNFGFVPCHSVAILNVEFINSGTASTTWELEPDWPNSEAFKLYTSPNATASPSTSGVIQVDETIRLPFSFQWHEPEVLQTTLRILVEGNPNPLEIHMLAEASEYKIVSDQLPEEFTMSCEINGASQIQTFNVMNDCVFDVPLLFQLICETPVLNHAWNSILQTIPSSLILPKNDIASDPQTATITLQVNPPSSTVLTLEELTMLLISGIDFNLQISSSTFSQLYTIPCSLRFAAEPIQYEETLAVDFGALHYEESASHAFTFQNSNTFPVLVQFSSTHTLITLVESDPVLPAQSSRSLTVRVLPQFYEHERDIPTELDVSGDLTLIFPCLNQTALVEVKVKFVDLQIPPEFSVVNFGMALVGSKDNFQTLTWKNWTRRPLTYHLQLDANVNSPSETEIMFLESEPSGTVEPHVPVTLKFRFSPPKLGSFLVPVHLITSSGTFTFELKGEGILPELHLEKDELDFGVIGVIEVRSLLIQNQSLFPIQLKCLLTSSDYFSIASSSQLTLSTHQEQVLIIHCSPPPLQEDICSILQFTTLDDVIVKECSLRAIGGEFHVLTKTFSPLVFPPIEPMEMTSLPVVFENKGTTNVTLAFIDPKTQTPIKKGQEIVGKFNRSAFGCSPISLTLLPGETKKFNVSMTGMQEGEDEVELLFMTQGHLQSTLFPFAVTSKIIQSIVPVAKPNKKALASFAKADATVEELLSIDFVERTKFRSDEGISKVLLKIVRIQSHSSLVLNDIPYPPVEPILPLPSFSDLLLRPQVFPTSSKDPKDDPSLSSLKSLHSKSKHPHLLPPLTSFAPLPPSSFLVSPLSSQEREQRKKEAQSMVQPIEQQVQLVSPKRQRNQYR